MNAARPGASYLTKVLQKYQAAGIPVYIAVKSTEQFQALWPELDGLVIPVSPKIELDPSDFFARSYAPCDAQLQLPTAAFWGEKGSVPFFGKRGPSPFSYALIFNGQPWRAMLQQRVQAVLAGECDDELVYRRRIRQPLDAYTRNRPPHVRAAQQLEQQRRDEGLPPCYRVGDSVAYVMTVNGPEPADKRRSPIDYQHYIDRQLLPVADSILPFIGESFAQLVAPQIDLF